MKDPVGALASPENNSKRYPPVFELADVGQEAVGLQAIPAAESILRQVASEGSAPALSRITEGPKDSGPFLLRIHVDLHLAAVDVLDVLLVPKLLPGVL